jgi:hypothetical protein
MLGPFGFLTDHPYWYLGLATAVLMAAGPAMQRIERTRLRNEVAPKNPILQWQRMGTKAAMDRLVAAWGPDGRRAARWTLLLDFAFLAAYGLMLTLLSSVGARYLRLSGSAGAANVWAVGAWVALAAPALDAVENVLLWRMLRPFEGERLPRTMTTVSWWKWLIGIGAGLVLAFPGLLFDLAGCRFGCP